MKNGESVDRVNARWTFCENLYFGQGQQDMEFPETGEHADGSRVMVESWEEKGVEGRDSRE